MNSSFTINPRVIAHLGEALIKNESIALLELIKNSYDAMASTCDVFFYHEKNILSAITITDDGEGMDFDTITKKWLVIGTDNKKRLLNEGIEKKYNRLPLGEKGIGRLGVHKLGNKIRLITRKQNAEEIELSINWSELDKVSAIEEFKIEINRHKEPSFFKENAHGTRIEINDLKPGWDRRKIRDVYRNILSLNSPVFFDAKENVSESFSVQTTSNDESLFEGLPTFDEIKSVGMYFAHCEMSGSRITQFDYSFVPWKTLDRVKGGRSIKVEDLSKTDFLTLKKKIVIEENGREKQKDVDVDLNKNKVGTIQFDVIIFEPDTQIISLMNLEKTTFRSYMRANGGVRVYRDNVRVYDYGEAGNDWLGIDAARIHKLGGNISNQIVLGAVRIRRDQSLGLVEKTNREGFVENEAYEDFVAAVQHALKLIVIQRNIDKASLSILYKEKKVIEPVLSDLDEVIQLVHDKVKNEQDKNEILKSIRKVSDQYKSVREILLRSANAGLNLGAIIHEIEKQISILKGCVERKDTQGVSEVSGRLDVVVRNAMSLLRKTDVKQNNLNDIANAVLNGFKYRFSDHHITVLQKADSTDITAFVSESRVKSILSNLFDNSIFWLSHANNDGEKILSIYVTDQMNDFNSIIVSDNGPGFTIPESLAVEPFVSGKPDNMGTGLGLYVCHEFVKSMDGKMEFCNINDYKLPAEIKKSNATRAIIALSFPKNNPKKK
ncbi:MAG: sensor histidine kinase [Fibrobacter sp.]|nr:sensor histidine kinase [Fibrobacter sp.]